jgi:hypothetical protein
MLHCSACGSRLDIKSGIDRRTKLTAEQIVAIRQQRANGRLLREIAIEFGVTISAIHRIAHRQVWKTVP